MTQETMPPMADLIAKTPGAQPRERALARIEARRAKRLASKRPHTPLEADVASPEPMPLIDNPDQFAAGFLERFKAKEKPTRPKRSKPKLVIDNEKPKPKPVK